MIRNANINMQIYILLQLLTFPLSRLCSPFTFQKPPTITSYTDTLLMRFQTDGSTSLRGFAVSFVAVEPPDEDLIDDLDAVTPFPGSMRSVYYTSDTGSDFDD